jgi:hypothetical protein
MEDSSQAVGARVDRGVMRLALLLACLVLAGCGPIQTPPARAEARIALFKECMELAAKMPRQADDDVADVVQACSNQALYMTNHIQ